MDNLSPLTDEQITILEDFISSPEMNAFGLALHNMIYSLDLDQNVKAYLHALGTPLAGLARALFNHETSIPPGIDPKKALENAAVSLATVFAHAFINSEITFQRPQ